MDILVTLPNDGRRQTIHLAAVCLSLGCEVTTELIHDYPSGKKHSTFFIGHSPEVLVQHKKASGEHGQDHILNLWRSGIAPLDHPFCDGVRALLNYEHLRLAVAGRVGWNLRLAEDGPHRTRYIPGDEIPSLITTTVARCNDLHKVAALGILGVPIVSIIGGIVSLADGITFPHSTGSGPSASSYSPAQILRTFDPSTIPASDPFGIAWNACRHLDTLDKHMAADCGKICYRRPPAIGENRPHRAYILPNATGDVMDRITRYVETGR
jgi:hypothetical protein